MIIDSAVLDKIEEMEARVNALEILVKELMEKEKEKEDAIIAFDKFEELRDSDMDMLSDLY